MTDSTFAIGRSVTPTMIKNNREYQPVLLHDLRASIGAFTYVDSVGGLRVTKPWALPDFCHVRWGGSSRMDSGWHAIGVRLSGPRLDGWVPSSVITQIYDVNMAVTHSGWGLHYLSTGDSLWIEAAHHSLRSTNAYGQLYALIAIPDTGDFYTRTELLGALPAFGGEDAFLAAVLRVC